MTDAGELDFARAMERSAEVMAGIDAYFANSLRDTIPVTPAVVPRTTTFEDGATLRAFRQQRAAQHLATMFPSGGPDAPYSGL